MLKQSRSFILTSVIITLIPSMAWSQDKMVQDAQSHNLTVDEMVSRINTQVNTEYIYEYEKAKFVPPDGKSLLIMGQTVETITEYLEHFPNHPLPGGWSAYWGIPEFVGVTEPHTNQFGFTQNHQMLIDAFPNTVVQSALWMVGKWDVAKNAGNGDYDQVVRQFGAWAKTADRPIYLRIGYEFDGPHNELEPEEYVRAYRHIVDVLRADGADNIAFVWHSYASKPYKDYATSDWYPGDDYVDWVGISVFGHAYSGPDFGPHCDAILQFARQKKKPVMIAESNPIYGIDMESSEVWDQWFVHFFTFIYNKNIKAVSFINENWPRAGIDGTAAWKDSRLYNNVKVSNAWFKETGKDRYLKQSEGLFKLLGYSAE